MKLFYVLSCGLLLAASFGFRPDRPASPQDDESATYYVVIADTSQSYAAVHQTLTDFQQASGLEIDSMGRYYNAGTGKLILPEDDEDEIYRGDYFPRRFPSTTLSIEYLAMYRPQSSETAFACVVGIYEKAADAKKVVRKWKSRFPKIYSQKADIYIGCMH